MAESSYLLRKFLRPLNRRRGQAAIEFTFGFLLFFALFVAIMEFSHLLYAKVTLQHSLRTAGRYMVTGRTALNNGQPIPRKEIIHNVFCANLIAAGVQCPPLGSPNFQFACIDPPANPCDGGGPTSTVMVTIRVSKPTLLPFFSQFFPSGGVPFQLSTTWKNEPYTPAN